MSIQLNSSILKAFSILQVFSERRSEITAKTLADELGLNGITAHRYLRTLERAGALVRVTKGSYRLSFVFVDLAERVAGQRMLAQVLEPIIRQAAKELRESVMATVFETDVIVCLACAHSDREVFVDVRVGARMEAYCTAHGKLWLAALGDAELERYLEGVSLTRHSPHTITDVETLRAEIAEVRRRGHAVNEGEREEGLRALAVPVKARNGRMLAGLSVFGPESRVTDAFLQRALERLKQAACAADLALYGAAA